MHETISLAGLLPGLFCFPVNSGGGVLTSVLALDAHIAHPGLFTADDLLPYRTAREPPCQTEALNRRKVMRKARSKKQRPILLAELERRYREAPEVELTVGSLLKKTDGPNWSDTPSAYPEDLPANLTPNFSAPTCMHPSAVAAIALSPSGA